jgi:hypothetical protein
MEASEMLCGLKFGRSRRRRNLASAFVGEIAAMMSVIEDSERIQQLKLATEGDDDGSDDSSVEVRDLRLPRFAVYEGNISELDVFDSPLPRELAYFYTRLAALSNCLSSLSTIVRHPAEERKQDARRALAELMRIMELGEDLLRNLRRLVSVKRPPSISRA